MHRSIVAATNLRIEQVIILVSLFSGGFLMPGLYNGVAEPKDGAHITYKDERIHVPPNPIIPFIEGDGTGRDIWKASVRVFDAAVEKRSEERRVGKECRSRWSPY